MKEYRAELLAPAGNMEAFKGAIHAGADAVYLGGPKYGARAYADNFTTEEVIFCIRYAHLFGRKVYLTVNTLMKDTELDELYDYLAPFYTAGLDAVIVQDMGVFSFIRKHFPQMELHVSTQMTLTGAYGASMLKKLGATRIVPARELSLQEIVYMKEQTGLEIETFIHGAMCYCYSGQCLFSSILGGRSGNRGRCAQPCRLSYSVDVAGQHLDDCYPLSLKDMCTLEHIGDFMDAGIDSFKIEGRMKKAEYAAGVTAIYRKYIDRKRKHPDKELKIDKKDLEDIAKLYIRSERQDGYYYKQNGADMVTLSSPAYSGSDEQLLEQIRRKYLENGLNKPVSIYATFFCGSEVSLTCICGEVSVTVTGDVMMPAQKQPMTEELIGKQLSKLGDTCFALENMEISTDNQGFYSVKMLNELRRKAIHQLEDAIIEDNGFVAARTCMVPDNKTVSIMASDANNLNLQAGWSILVSTPEQLDVVCSMYHPDLQISAVYIESDLLLNHPDIKLPQTADNIYIALPYIMRKKDIPTIRQLLSFSAEKSNIKGMLIRNYEEYEFLKASGYNGNMIADAGIYIWNQEAYAFWKDKVAGITCPIELNQHEWQALFQNRPLEKIVYGRLPMMVTANCIAKTGGRCLNSKEFVTGHLTDRYKKDFPVILQCRYCTNILLNSVPLSLHGKEYLKWYPKTIKRLSFTTEDAGETKDVLEFFFGLTNASSSKPPYKEYTTGHEKRGVE